MFEGIDLNQIMKQAQDFQKELQKKKEEMSLIFIFHNHTQRVSF